MVLVGASGRGVLMFSGDNSHGGTGAVEVVATDVCLSLHCLSSLAV